MSMQAQQNLDAADYMRTVGVAARTASRAMAKADTGTKNAALAEIARTIDERGSSIITANRKDLESGRRNGLAAALLDRLELNPERIVAMADGLRQIASLQDPIGEISDLRYRPSGIQVGRMRVPLGVVGIIYESRPNVTADAAGLCLKAGNAAILRGGSEAIHSNLVIAECIELGLSGAGLPPQGAQVVAVTERSAVGALLRMPEYVDVIVPRGGKGLIERVVQESLIPVIKHLDGVCHVYIDDAAEVDKAVAVAFNAKTQRYATCCTLETLLVAAGIADRVLPELASLYQEAGVELRGCPQTQRLIPNATAANEEDWGTEYLAPILSVRVVSDLDAAIDHIDRYGSNHTDAIVTEDLCRARRFLSEVDSSSVMVNASTRFADGFEYGLGAEIGISTDKLHARGPVGLEGLTSQKYVVFGDGHIRR